MLSDGSFLLPLLAAFFSEFAKRISPLHLSRALPLPYLPLLPSCPHYHVLHVSRIFVFSPIIFCMNISSILLPIYLSLLQVACASRRPSLAYLLLSPNPNRICFCHFSLFLLFSNSPEYSQQIHVIPKAVLNTLKAASTPKSLECGIESPK